MTIVPALHDMNQPCQTSRGPHAFHLPGDTPAAAGADAFASSLTDGVLGDARYEAALLAWLSSTDDAVKACPRGRLLDSLALELSTLARRYDRALAECESLPLSTSALASVRRMAAAIHQVSETARHKALDLSAEI